MAESFQEDHLQNGIEVTTNDNDSVPPPSAKQRRPSVDKDAQEMVIESLRTQIQDLISQVSELNNKLVKSYDRVSDLEDDLHVASANSRSSSLKISQLELERTQHLAALNTGLLVEKSHVTSELTRLMEKATEEAAQRGQAESARNAIEKDLDDLSASLFGQANTMVAEARFEKHLSERKVEDAQRALKSAEEVVQLMQTQMQTLQAEKEDAERKTQEMEFAMGKGKWAPRPDGAVSLRLLSAHSPYQEFMAFVAHLRLLHPASPQQSPAMSTLLQLPFLTRLLTEDSEPTVRLDLAPSLNWLSRRSVLTAIHSGQLMIEPMLAATLFAESSTHTTIAGINSTNDNISCALCGASIFPTTTESSHHTRPPAHPAIHNHSTSWSGAFFKKTGSIGYINGNTTPPTRSLQHSSIAAHLNSQVFIFRLASPPTSSIASLPIPSLTPSYSSPIPSSYSSPISNGNTPQSGGGIIMSTTTQPTTIYPLCMSGWCLNRLRSTCTLWAFVRTGIVEKVWEEELAPPPSPPQPPPPAAVLVEKNPSGEKPPLPPRKRGIWGGIASAIGEKAASWSDNDKDKAKKASEPRRVPPPLPPIDSSKPPPPAAAAPPPLPKRHEKREKTPVPSPLPSDTAEEDTNGSATSDAPAPPPTSMPSTSTDSNLPPIPLSPIRARHLQSSSSTTGHPDRSSTPSSIPLPDSRPITPATPAATTTTTTTATATAPSRTTSPAIATASSGPPPPIPRRAAARTRVAEVSRPATPTPANANANAAPSSPVVAADATAEANERARESESEGTAAAAAAAANTREAGRVDVTDGAATPKGGGDVVVEKEIKVRPSDEFESSVDVSPTAPPAGEAVVNEKAGDDDKRGSVVVEGHTPVESPVEEAVVANGVVSEEYVHVNGVQEEEEERAKEKEEKSKIAYVGDATWEEKTWKEIVRLREDMFWARIGGVRE